MVFKISYFYNVRHMKPYQVPVSTAMYDPKWFHNNKGHGHVFVDKNGVINGLRHEALKPGDSCNGTCQGRELCQGNPDYCLFLRMYEDQLKGTDFDKVKKELEEGVSHVAKLNPMYSGEPLECILMVYEKPDNPCSERGPLKKWFMENGVELLEFER